MPSDRPWSDADRELESAAAAVHQAYLDTCARLGWPVKPANRVPYDELSEEAKELDRASVRAVRDALTAAGWRPPPPKPDGIHWRTGTTVGRTLYNPHGALAGLVDTPEQARAVVAALNAATEGGTDA